MSYSLMLAKSKRLSEEIKSLKAKIAKLPKGKFYCARNGNSYKWYLNDHHKRMYIPKKKRALAQQLAYQKYLSLQLDELTQEKLAVDSYLSNHDLTESPSLKLLTTPEYRELLEPFLSVTSDKFTSWMNSPYPKNPNHPENLTCTTSSGIMVRSKSEAIIEALLHTNHIPFRYECSLERDGITMYPDFTILHPVTGKVYYWEHFGLIDKPGYQQTVLSKLQFYFSHGIVPTINLITTYETNDNPLSVATVKNLVEHYFL